MIDESASVTTATRSGNGRTNQDHAIVTDHAMAVLDGATSWLPQPPGRDGGWYARVLGAALTARLDDDHVRLPAIVADAIDEVRQRYGLRDEDCPTSTVAIARWTPDTVQMYVLGDSPAVAFSVDGDVHELYDARLDDVGRAERTGYRAHLSDGHGYDQRLAELVAELQLAERRRRNREGGYWIAGADPAAAEHGVTIEHPRDELDAVVLASDGASCAVHEYALHTWSTLRAALRDGPPARLLDSVHDAEDQDPDGVRWPRAKRHDDKTLTVWS